MVRLGECVDRVLDTQEGLEALTDMRKRKVEERTERAQVAHFGEDDPCGWTSTGKRSRNEQVHC